MSIALWCLLVAGVLPIACAGLSKYLAGGYDNNDPRGQALSYTGKAKRANAAQANGHEAFPLFAAAVLVAEMKGTSGGTVGLLAVLFILCRIGYIAAYVLDKATVRSLLWIAGFALTIAILLSPLWR